MKREFSILIVVLGLPVMSQGQGDFVNLDFEHPLLPLSGLEVPISSALPGWQGYFGSTEQGSVCYNTRALDAAAISLHTIGSDSFQPIRGSYSVFLQGSSMFSPPPIYSASLAQTGQIPSDAQAIRFAAGQGSGGYIVTFAGQGLPLFQVGSGSNYVVMAADISGYAGQIGELRFTANPQGGLYFDSVAFSSTPIPEPTGPSLLGLVALALAWRSVSIARKYEL